MRPLKRESNSVALLDSPSSNSLAAVERVGIRRKPLPAIVDALLLDHRYKLRLLETLDELTLMIKHNTCRKSTAQLLLLQAILRYLSEVNDPHHHVLEDQVVDILVERLVSRDNTDLLAHHDVHKALQKDLAALQKCAKRALKSRPDLSSKLRDLTTRYIDSLSNHINQEERTLFPLAVKTLKKADWQNLKTTKPTDPLFGSETTEPYLELFAFLTKRISRIGVEGSNLVLIRYATSAAERMDALSTGAEDIKEMLVEQAHSHWHQQRELFSNILKAHDPGSVIKLAAKMTSASMRGALNAISGSMEIAMATGSALISPHEHLRANKLLPEGVMNQQHKISWQAQAISIPLRIWLKKKIKDGEVEELRTWARRGEYLAGLLAKKITSKPVKIKEVRAEWIAPETEPGQRVLLYLPGGAFILPATTAHRAFVARLCEAMAASALLVHYRLAPEHPFPAGLEDCLTAYRHLLAKGIDARQIVIAGDSAGGGLVLSTLLALKEAGDPLPAAAVALSPLADLTYSGASRGYNRHQDPLLSSKRSVHLNDIYLKDHAAEHPLVSPIYGDFSGLPPILIQVGSTEMLLDDSLRLAERARAQGVSVEVEMWHKMPHVWHVWTMLPESSKAISRIAKFARQHVPDVVPR